MRRCTVGVWVGNFSGEPMGNVSGTAGAAPIWRDMMMWLHRDTPSVAPVAPAGLVRAHVAFGRATAPARDEWLLAGTEPVAAIARAAAPMPTIVTPARGTRIAIDPDIPPSHQRVTFEARDAPIDARWVLDEVEIGGGSLLLWAPRPGRHALALVDADGRVRDTAIFDVRGAASAD